MWGTSASAPAVAGSIVLFRDWYRDVVGNDIDDPGLAYANLLLMGDRTEESGGRMTVGFDSLWGAGALRLRTFDADGLSAPAGWGDDFLCVDGGTYEYVNLPTIPAGTGILRVVSWNYDHRHDDGVSQDHDNVDLAVQRYPGSFWLTTANDTSSDNKHRIHVDSPNAGPARIRLYGRDVTSDDEGCGTNSTMVWYAWFYESNSRPTSGLLHYIRPEGP
jgi:hypothetical protein